MVSFFSFVFFADGLKGVCDRSCRESVSVVDGVRQSNVLVKLRVACPDLLAKLVATLDVGIVVLVE